MRRLGYYKCMKQLNPTAPKISNNLETIDDSKLAAEVRLDNVLLADGEAIGLVAPNMAWDESILERVLFSGANLEKLRASDVKLTDCDMSTSRCAETSWIRVAFRRGRMSGWDASRSLLQDIEFNGCKLDMANFRYAKLERVRFVDCVLAEADFLAAELKYVEFQSCHLEKVQFSQTKLQAVDLRGSQLIDIGGWKDMKGATISDVQLMQIAPYLANELGIVVEG